MGENLQEADFSPACNLTKHFAEVDIAGSAQALNVMVTCRFCGSMASLVRRWPLSAL